MKMRLPGDPVVSFRPDYVEYDEAGERVRVMCRKCWEIIADIIDISATQDAAGNTTIRQSFKLLPNYTKVVLLLTGGMRMESAMCKKCAKWLGADEITELYESEILAIARDGEVHNNVDVVQPIVDDLRTRSVIRRIG